MEVPAKTELEDKESQVNNNGSENDSNELSQQSGSPEIASGETPETESTVTVSLLKEGENEESLEYNPETKSGKKKKNKRKKKKAEMTSVAPDSTEQLLSTSSSNVEETNAKIDSASTGQTPGKECKELDPAEDSPANKKKKKKKKKKTKSKVCDTLENQLDNQDISSVPKEEKSVEDQGNLAVMKNEKQENDADNKSQKECGDAVSSGIENVSENLSEDSLAETAAARAEEENVPASEKEDGSTSKIVPDEVKPELALEKQLDNQDISSAPTEEKSVEDQGNLAVMKNEKQENDGDTRSQKECGDAVSSGIEDVSENLSEDSPEDTSGAREEENVPASEKEDGSTSELVPDEVKPELATISDGAKESHVDTGLTDMPEDLEEEVESDSAGGLSDEPDNEGFITMEVPAKTELEDKESQVNNNGSKNDSNELSQQSGSPEIASGETPETESTVTVSLLKEGENEESSEYNPETKSGKKKKKNKRKKKKAEMTSVAPDSTEQLLSTSSSNVEETNAKIDSASTGQTPGKECKELDPAEDSPANKKKKKKKKKKTKSKVCDTLENQLDNQDISSVPKEEKSVEDQGNLAVMKNEKQENDADNKSLKECGDAVSSGIENVSENLSEDSLAETAAARAEEENVPASEKEDGSTSELVPDEVKPELATISDGAKESHVDTGLTDMPEDLEEEVESDSAGGLSDEPDNEGTTCYVWAYITQWASRCCEGD